MLRCPLCAQEASDTQIEGGRCPHCGGIVRWNSPASQVEAPSTTPSQPTSAEKPPHAGVYATINPRDLTPEMKRTMDSLWGDAAEAAESPQMTIKNNSATIVSGLDLVIPSRRLRKNDEVEITARADYELSHVVGEGGVGTVFSARQASINRTVAIKMLREGIDSDMASREKFLAEAVVTGELEHPNIVPIYDVGSSSKGQLFYSMKLVHGTPWNQAVESKSLLENLSILMRVSDAVAFAHAKGVVHRDLKPENVMLGGFGEVLVMDWGIAISTEMLKKDPDIKKTVGMGGTPAYMAPEMASGPLEAIDRRSDVYLLGAILFEIITGYAPHTGTTVTSCLFAAARNEIVPTDKSGELLEIAYRAMSTQRPERHQSVAEFQEAIREYQSHSESIALAKRAEQDLAQAQQSGDYQHFSRTLFGYQEAIELWNENESAHRGLTAATIAYAETALAGGDYDLGLSLLDPEARETAALYKKLSTGKRERELRQQRLRNVRRMVAGLLLLIFVVVSGFLFVVLQQQSELASRNEELLSTSKSLASKTESLQQREITLTKQAETLAKQTNQLLANQNELTTKNSQLEDERNLAQRLTVEAQQAESAAVESRKVAQYRSYLAQIGLAAAKIEENAFRDASRILDSYSNSPLKHWEWGRLQHFQQLDLRTIEGQIPIDSVAYSPDGKRVALGRRDGSVTIQAVDSGEETLLEIDTGGQYVFDLEFSPDGRQLATAGDSSGNYLALWDATTGARLPNLFQQEPHTDWCLSVDFSTDGKLLTSTSYDKTAKVWSLPGGRLLQTLAGHHRPVWDAAIAPDQHTIVTASEDGTAIVWRDPAGTWDRPRSTSQIMPKFSQHRGPIYAVAFAPDGKLVATAGHGNQVKLWNPAEVKPFSFQQALASQGTAAAADDQTVAHADLAGHTAAVRSLDFSPDGKLLLSGSSDNTMIVWNVAQQQRLKQLRGHSDTVSSAVFSPVESGELLSGSFDGNAKFWSVAGYHEQQVLLAKVLSGHEDAVLAASFDREGQRVVTASRDRTSRIWDLAQDNPTTSEPITLREGHDYLVSTTLFTPEALHMITAAMDNTLRIWDVRTGAQLHTIDGTGRRAVADISADARWLLTAGDDNRGHLYDLQPMLAGEPAQGAPVRVAQEPRPGTITAAVFVNAEGSSLAVGDEFGRCSLYRRTSTGSFEEVWTEESHGQEVTALRYLPTTAQLVTASLDGTIRFHDLISGQERESQRMVHPAAVAAFDLVDEGQQILSACTDGNLRLWNTADARLEQTFAPLLGGSKSLAANVRRQMSLRSWSESELAGQTGLEQGVVRRVLGGQYEVGENAQADSAISRLADSFGLPAAQLLVALTNSVAVDQQRKLAVTTSSVEGSVHFWDLASGKQLDTQAARQSHSLGLNPERIEGSVAAARFAPGTSTLVVSGGRRSVAWDLASGEQLMVYSPHGAIAAANFSPKAEFVVTGSWDGTAKVWNAQTGQAVMRLSGGHAGPINSATFSPAGKQVLTASDDGTARLWDWQAGTLLDSPVFRHQAPIRSALFSPDGQYIATASDDAHVNIWEVASGKRVHRLAGHRSAVLCAAFSTDGQSLLTGSRDQTARIWNVATGELSAIAQGHTSEINSVAFSPDGRRAITGSSDQTAKLWDAQPPVEASAGPTILQEVLTLSGHTDAVTSAMFSPRGESILTAGRDSTVILWEAESIPASIFLAETDLVLPTGTQTHLLAPQAVFSAPNRVDFAEAVITVKLLSETANAGQIGLSAAASGAGAIAVEGESLYYQHAASERVGFATLASGSADNSLQITLNASAQHATIQQLLRQLQIRYDSSERVPTNAVLEVSIRFPADNKLIRSTRAIEAQESMQADMAVR